MANAQVKKPTNISTEWDSLDRSRTYALDRKRAHAALTIPSLLPPEGLAQNQPLPVPYNAESAQGINSLAARLTTATIPLSGLPLLQFYVDEAANPDGQDLTEAEKKFRFAEKVTTNRLQRTNLRAKSYTAWKHLLCVGDVLVYQEEDYNFTVFRADQYVVQRNARGDWRNLIICQFIDPNLQDDEIKAIPKSGTDHDQSRKPATPDGATLEPLYTKATRMSNDGEVTIVQEFRGTQFNRRTVKTSPYFPLRADDVAGEDYSTSKTQDIFGDISSLDGLTAGLNDGVALNAEYRWGVNPAGITELRDVEDSANGAFVPMAQQDVFPLTFANSAQVRDTLVAVQHREAKVGRAYLSHSASQPTGERVTARQAAIFAEELNSALGGLLSLVDSEYLEAVVRNTLRMMGEEKDGPLTAEQVDEILDPDTGLHTQIRTGLELLQREAEQEKLDEFLARASQLPESALRHLDWGGIMNKIINNMGMSTVGLVKSNKQVQDEDAAALAQQQNAAVQQALVQQAAQASQQPQESTA